MIFRNSSRDQVETLAWAIIATLSEPFFVGDHALHIGATVGIAAAPYDSTEAETLLRYADLALYSAKARKRGTLCRFEKAMDVAAQEKARLEGDFREAVQQGELNVHYQPLINLESDEVEGYEALLRWLHPVRGEVSPEVFVPLAEEMGLIEQIGQFVLQTACRAAAAWDDGIKLAVNVSPLQFRNGNLLNSVIQSLAASGLPAERLELEITEAVLMDKGPRTAGHHPRTPLVRDRHLDGRLRHRLQLAALSAQLTPSPRSRSTSPSFSVSARRANSRAVIRAVDRPRPQPRDDRHRRGDRARGRARLPEGRRLRAGAGLPVRRGAAGGRDFRHRARRGRRLRSV